MNIDEVKLDKIMIAGFEITDVLAYAHTFPQECFTSGCYRSKCNV